MHITLTVLPDPDRARRQVRAAMRGKFLRLYVLGAALVAGGAFALLRDIRVGYALVVLGVLLATFPLVLPRAAAKSRTGLLAEPVTYELTETNVLAKTPSLSNGYAWDAVDRIEENGEFWVLMVRGIGALALPWTLLPAGREQEARAFLTARGLLTS